MESLNTLSAVEIRDAISRGDATCEQVAEACLARIEAREGALKAWAHIDRDLALAEARKLDRASEKGPMHGVPVAVKDVIDTFDMPTQMGSPIYKGFQPPADASCVAILRSAGALILGKVVTCEFAGPAPSETHNPHHSERTPGGSSSGSGAAVADFQAPIAFGTQTGGSIVRPSSYCGIVGFKPSFGAINPCGVKPAAESLDTVGLMARTVEDAELAFRVLTNCAAPHWLAPQTKLRIGLCRTFAWDKAEAPTQAAVLDAAERLVAQGHAVIDVKLPRACEELPHTRELINDYERARGMAHEWRIHEKLISPQLAKSIRNGLTIDAHTYTQALRHIERCRRMIVPLFDRVDVLLTPAVAGEAPTGLHHTGDHTFQSIWTQLHAPAITVPTHQGPNGLPVGIQLAGPRGGDVGLLAMARLIFGQLGRGPAIDITGAKTRTPSIA